MRASTCGFLLGAGLLVVVGCDDEKADPVVQEGVGWQVKCASALTPHRQSDVVEIGVSCEKGQLGYNIELVDEGDPEKDRPRSVVTITNLDPETQDCEVTVEEERVPGDSATLFSDRCEEGCTVTTVEDDWDVHTFVKCTQFSPEGSAEECSFVKGGSLANQTKAVEIAIDNCD